MLPVYSGSDENINAVIDGQIAEVQMLRLGLAEKIIPLNGGSDTRKASREYWKEFSEDFGIEYRGFGSMVILGRVGGE